MLSTEHAGPGQPGEEQRNRGRKETESARREEALCWVLQETPKAVPQTVTCPGGPQILTEKEHMQLKC